MDIKKYVLKVLQDDNGNPSSKRWIALITLVMIITTWAANLFFHLQITEFIYDSLVWLMVGSMGFTGVEKFAPPKPPYVDDSSKEN
jgi:hypothetical protein